MTEQHSDGPGVAKNDAAKGEAAWLKRACVGLIIVGVAAAGVAGLSMLPKREKAKPKRTAAITDVEIMTVTPVAALPDTLTLPGVAEPDRVVRVSAEVAGRVLRIQSEKGAQCSEGVPLVMLDTELISAEVAQAEAGVKQAVATVQINVAEVASVSRLREQDAATEFTLKQARSQLEASRAGLLRAKATLLSAKIRLARTRIVSPVCGVLNRVDVEEGEYVQAGDPIAEVVDTGIVRIAVEVPERVIGDLKLWDEPDVLVGVGDESRRLRGSIGYISELADAAARTTRVEVLVDNTSGALRSGQIVMVRLTRRVIRNAVMIPLAAVIPLESGRAVYVVEDGEAKRREVTLGVWRGRDVQILSGLSGGESLIVRGHRYVGPGQPVNVVKASPATSLPSWSGRRGK